MSDKNIQMVSFKCSARSRNLVPPGDHLAGLRGCLMISQDGVVFEVSKPNYEAPSVHQVVKIERQLSEYKWHKQGFVRVQRLPAAPADVVRQVWGLTPVIKTREDFMRDMAITSVATNKDKFSKDDPGLADWDNVEPTE